MNGYAHLRRHDRQSFFKYMNCDVAKIVLTNRTLRWSSQGVLNDPFDLSDLELGFTVEQVRDAMIEDLARLIENPEHRDISGWPDLRTFLERVRNGHRERRLATAAFTRTLADRIDLEFFRESYEEVLEVWRDRLPHIRILCVTETNNNEVMWAHYSEEQRGVVLEFKCLDDLGNELLLAQRVRYADNLPSVATIEDALRVVFTGGRLFDPEAVNVNCIYTKTSKWAYEQEWRVHTFALGGDNGQYSDRRFNPRELGAVYVGARMSAANIDEIRGLLIGDLAGVPMFQCVHNRRERRIEFGRLV